jgi:hypothetical protein
VNRIVISLGGKNLFVKRSASLKINAHILISSEKKKSMMLRETPTYQHSATTVHNLEGAWLGALLIFEDGGRDWHLQNHKR